MTYEQIYGLCRKAEGADLARFVAGMHVIIRRDVTGERMDDYSDFLEGLHRILEERDIMEVPALDHGVRNRGVLLRRPVCIKGIKALAVIN